jgi:hypothetical protein
VLAAIFLIFTEGHTATSGDALTRTDLSAEAIRLGRVLVDLMPDEPEAVGLLALMLLTDARRPARTAPDGTMRRLADQDRALWDRDLIAEGHDLVRACLRRNRPGPYQIQAAIAAVHADAASHETTDWTQIVALYDQLYAQRPDPVVGLNRAIAIAEVDGPAVGLAALAAQDTDRLADYQPYHAARADPSCGPATTPMRSRPTTGPSSSPTILQNARSSSVSAGEPMTQPIRRPPRSIPESVATSPSGAVSLPDRDPAAVPSGFAPKAPNTSGCAYPRSDRRRNWRMNRGGSPQKALR